MKNVDTIICKVMTDKDFDTIQNAQYDRWEMDRRIARNGMRRLVYNLNKYGLTVEDWDRWCGHI